VLAIAEALERGAYGGRLASALEGLWGQTVGRSVVRRLTWPPHVRVLAVGGATLGGSGKTPLAVACAAALAARGASVALVGHAYRATPGRARVVHGDDSLDEVGDEALLAARALDPWGVRVVVAPKRSAAVALAARMADVLVLDGVAQTSPLRASLALLAVDSIEPWGQAIALPPRGDLRAPVSRLLGACDMLVAVGSERPVASLSGAHHARTEIRGAWVGGELVRCEGLRRLRIGLLCALARPDRVVRSLAASGIAVRVVVRAPDHGPFSRGGLQAIRRESVDLWLATPKCALHVPSGSPVACASSAAAPTAAGGTLGVICSTCVLPRSLNLDLTIRRQ
jgi:tetraacyldisaccharide 4'-kinase